MRGENNMQWTSLFSSLRGHSQIIRLSDRTLCVSYSPVMSASVCCFFVFFASYSDFSLFVFTFLFIFSYPLFSFFSSLVFIPVCFPLLFFPLFCLFLLFVPSLSSYSLLFLFVSFFFLVSPSLNFFYHFSYLTFVWSPFLSLVSISLFLPLLFFPFLLHFSVLFSSIFLLCFSLIPLHIFSLLSF